MCEKINKFLYYMWYVIASILLGASIIWTAKYNMNDFPFFERTRVIQILLFLSVMLVYYVIFKFARYIEKLPYIIMIGFFFAIGAFFVILLPIKPISDPTYVVQGAIDIASGNIDGILQSDYLQAVLKNIKVSLFYAFFIMPLPKNVISLRMINVIFYILIAYFSGKIACLYKHSGKIVFILVASFAPLIIYVNQVYFDIPVLLLSVVALYIYLRNKKSTSFCLAIILLALASSLRVLGLIFIVAICFDYFTYLCVERKKIGCWIVFACAILVAMLFISGSDVVIDALFRKEDARDESIWTLFWGGINEPEFGMMHNEYFVRGFYSNVGFNDFIDTLFSRSLLQNIRFFGRKIMWVWTQGTYQCQRYGFGYDVGENDKFIYETILTNHFYYSYQLIPRALVHIGRAQYMALFTYMIFGIKSCAKSNDRNRYNVFLYVFLLTFGVLVFYEMKSRYVFHMIPVMVLFAVKGLGECERMLKTLQLKRVVDYKRCYALCSWILILVLSALCVLASSEALSTCDWCDTRLVESKIENARVLSQKSGLNLLEREIVIPNLNREYVFLYVSDQHVYASDEEIVTSWGIDKKTRLETFRYNANDMTSDLQFSEWLKIAEESKMDGMLLGGDIIDFSDEKNVGWIQSKLDNMEIPYLYTLGNHDAYDFKTNSQRPENDNIVQLFDGQVDCSYIDYGQFIVCQVNTSINKVSKTTLDKFNEVYKMNKPIILITHVPLCSADYDGLKQAVDDRYAEDRLIGSGLDYNMDSTTQTFYDLVTAEDSPVMAVLSGHVHFQYDEMINGVIPEFVNSSARDGQAYLIRVRQ